MTDLASRIQDALGDGYHVEGELQPGGMSRLFVATERGLDRRVVIKVLPPEFSDEVSVARFRREIEVSAHLQHPNLLPILTAGARDDLLWYITPYIAGDSLRRLLEREGKLPVSEAVRMLRDLADALATAHEHGVIHRDIKPSNILLVGRRPVLADFGIAHALIAARGGPDRITATGAMVGTVGCMSPEQTAGGAEVDVRSDIYSLALVGYEMLTGVPPFAGRTGLETVRAHLLEVPPSVQKIRPEVPSAVSDAIDKALAKKPEDRFATAAEFRDALDRGVPASAGWRRWRRWIIAAGAAATAALLALSLARRTMGVKLDRKLVAIAPFDVTDEEYGVWKQGLVDILARNLDGMAALRTVSSSEVLRDWKGPASKSTADALGRRTGAGLVVYGKLTRVATDSARLEASVLDVASGRVLGVVDRRSGNRQLYQLSDQVTNDLLAMIGASGRANTTRAASLGSTSPEAIRTFLEAEQNYREHKYLAALAGYERAISLDSSFALAYRGAAYAMTGEQGGADSTSLRYQLRAGALNHHLSARDSLWLAADSADAAAFTDNDPGTRVRMGRRYLNTLERMALQYPTDPEVWEELGGARLYFGERFGVTREQTLQAYEQSVSLDSMYGPSYFYLLEFSPEFRDTAVVRRYAKQYALVDPNEPGALVAQLMNGRGHAMADSGPWLDTMPLDRIEKAGFLLRRWSDDGETALQLGRRAVSDTDAATKASLGRWFPPALAWRGHVREAYAVAWGPRRESSEFLTSVGVLGAVPDDSATAVLDRTRRGTRAAAMTLALPWWAQRGDTAALAAAVRRIDLVARTQPQDDDDRDPAPAYGVAAARAYLALARRDTAAALTLFAAIPDSLCSYRCWSDRLTRARLLHLRGNAAQAAAVLDGRPLSQSYQSVGEVLWLLERARIAEDMGDRERAVSAYLRIRDAWLHADPVLRPLVEETNRAIARLQGERGSAVVPHSSP